MKRRVGAGGLIGLLLVVLVAAVVYGRSQANQPQAILETALANGLLATSATVALDYTNGSPDAPGDRLELSGILASEGRFDVSGSYSRGNDTVGIAVRSPEGNDAFVRMENMAGLGRLLGEEADDYGITPTRNPLLGLDGRWLTVPSGIKDTVLLGGAVAAADGQRLNDGDRRRLGELFRSNRFVTVERQLGDEIIKGQLTYRYRLGVDAAKLDAFLRAVRRDVPRLALTEQRAQALQDNLTQADRLEIWISQNGRQPLQFRLHNLQAGKTRDIQLTVSDYGRPVKIATPQPATPLFEALQGINQNTLR